jgi:hypothetical protein
MKAPSSSDVEMVVRRATRQPIKVPITTIRITDTPENVSELLITSPRLKMMRS